jgi:hypothetical protein
LGRDPLSQRAFPWLLHTFGVDVSIGFDWVMETVIWIYIYIIIYILYIYIIIFSDIYIGLRQDRIKVAYLCSAATHLNHRLVS